jgi:hypothetical protein
MTAETRALEKAGLRRFLAASGGLAAVCILLLVVEVIQVGSVA